MFRELHTIKGEASAVNLPSVAHRVHAPRGHGERAQEAPELSGNDFLPIVLKLDELMAHLRSVRELATRLPRCARAPPRACAATAALRGRIRRPPATDG